MTLPRGRVIPAHLFGEMAAATDALTVHRPPEPTEPPSAPTRPRVIPADAMRIHQEAEACLSRARSEAEQIVQAAQLEAARVREAAEKEGHETGTAAIAAGWVHLHAAQARSAIENEQRILEISRILAEKLLNKALELDPVLVVDLAREAIQTVLRAHRFVFLAHPADVATLTQYRHTLGPELSLIDVQPDESQARGSLRIETDLGVLDANVSHQLDLLLEALRQPAPQPV